MHVLIAGLCTCILVLMTSSGVFPNTLAAPAIAPNAPVMMGLMDLLGLSPRKQKTNPCDKTFTELLQPAEGSTAQDATA